MLFSSKKAYQKSRYPSDWPSFLHNKCSKFGSCKYANPPQALEGLYSCSGTLKDGRPCNGTYTVTRLAVEEVMNIHKNVTRIAEKERQNAQIAPKEAARQKEADKSSNSNKAVRVASSSASSSSSSKKDKALPSLPVEDLDINAPRLGRRHAQRKGGRQSPSQLPPNPYLTGPGVSWYIKNQPSSVPRRDTPVQYPFLADQSWYRPTPN